MRDRDLRRWRALVRQRADAEWRELSLDVIDELACHLADLHSSALRRGAADVEADRLALEALNSASFVDLSKRPRARRISGGYMHDIRLAIRHLCAAPVVTAVAILSLALGIGANTAMFSLVDSLVLRTLPVKAPDQLARLTEEANRGQASWTYAIWRTLHDRVDLFERAFAWSTMRFNLAERGETEFVDGMWASAGIFDTLGIAPILGRGFSEADDQRGGGPDGPVAVVSYSFWQRRFGGTADTIGRRLTVERVPFTIIGVMPPDFFGPVVGRRLDIAIPIGTEPLIRGKESALDNSWWWWLEVMGRLPAGRSIDTQSAALRGVLPQIREATMPTEPADARAIYMKDPLTLVPAATGSSSLRERYQRPLVALMIVVALVLLIACANIANLLLARATARRHEMSVRRALGASRWRLARQLLVESLVLSSTGAVLGLLFARWGSRLLVRQLSTATNTVFLDLSLDWRVLAFTAAVTTVTALLFGVAPALRTASVEPMDAMREHGSTSARGASAGRRVFGTRVNLAGSLVVVQVALSVVLVVAAGLFVRTFTNLANLHLGFEREGLLLVDINLQRARIEPPQRGAVIERALEAVAGLPGVARAGVSALTPVSGQTWNNRVEVSDGVPLTDRQRSTNRNTVSPGWFATYGTPLLAGRDLRDSDRDGAPLVGIVNEAFARRFPNGANPIGHTVRQTGGMKPWGPLEIVGLVSDAVYRSVREPVPPTLYTPLAQTELGLPFTSMSVTVRAAAGSPALLTRSVAAAINGVHPDLALTFRLLSDQVNASLTQERIVAMLSGFFGALALLLAGLGLYGVTSYFVTRRRTEIGIRLALGAPPGGVVRFVFARVAVLVVTGIAIGTLSSVWASRFVASLLYGLDPRDFTTLAGAVATLATVGAIAGWLPASRAARIDPAEVLRES